MQALTGTRPGHMGIMLQRLVEDLHDLLLADRRAAPRAHGDRPRGVLGPVTESFRAAAYAESVAIEVEVRSAAGTGTVVTLDLRS